MRTIVSVFSPSTLRDENNKTGVSSLYTSLSIFLVPTPLDIDCIPRLVGLEACSDRFMILYWV